MEQVRQLVAIMFTDIQGYTNLMQHNEKEAIKVREKHRRIFKMATEQYHGRILQYYGDGTLSVFNSAIEAVNCGIKLQAGFQEVPAIPVRIGIHSGDIIFSEEEVIGDGVNVAARIESLAVPGSVFISEKVYDEIKNQVDIQATLMKAFKFKNVEKPIAVYAIANNGLVVPKPETLKGKTDPAHSSPKTAISIAVLAFENMSGDPDQEYFSDGVSEEILNGLVKVEGLKVAGRTSAFFFKGRHEDIHTIGEKLDVKMVLEGSVRKDGKQVRITAQLINVEDGYHLWSETYDRELENIFAVQEDIADHIVEKLKLQVLDSTESKNRTTNMEAYELLLKGIYFFNKGYESKPQGLECFQKAVELDPDYAEAFAWIGETYLHYAGFLLSTSDAYSKARTAAQKAIGLNNREPRAHKVLAYIYLFYDWDWEATLVEYNTALQCGLPDQNEFITYYYIFVDKNYDHAIRVSQQILETNPLNVQSHWQLGICNYFAGKFEDALLAFNNGLELDHNYSEAHHWKGVVLGHLGKFEAAIVALNMAQAMTQGTGPAGFDLLVVKIQMGKREEVLQMFNPEDFIDPADTARIYTLLGMYDEAFVWLEKAYRERSVMMITLKHFWFWDPIRDDPRFMEIFKRLNFPE